jgi:butyryl-CoA dehydrogenase
MTDADFEWLMGINFWGVVHGTKAYLPHLIASGDGHIVNISSVFGLIGVPSQAAYNAAKFAVRGYTECLRQELEIAGHPVSATSVHPGGIKTNIVHSARLHQVEGGPSREDAVAQFERAARTTPERAAQVILEGVQRNRRRVLIGLDARVIDWVQRLFPTGYQRLITAAVKRRGPIV